MKLLDNGIDSLKKTIKLLNKLNENEIHDEYIKKDIILMFHHAIEVIIKFCLVNSFGEIMIQDNFTKACSDFNSEKATREISKTITFMEAVERFYALNKRAININVLNGYYYLNEYRNGITHYTVNLSDKEIQHLIGRILMPELHTIMREYIPEFPLLLISDLLEVGKVMSNDNKYWYWKVVSSILNNYFIAKKYIKKIEKEKEIIQSVIKARKKVDKKNYISYEKCPICKKETYFVKGSIILKTGIGYPWGNCELCGFEINQSQSYVLTLSEEFDENKTLDQLLIGNFFDLMDDFEDVKKRLLKKDINNFKKFYHYNKNEILDMSKNIFNDFLIEAIAENDVEAELIDNNRYRIPTLDEYEFSLLDDMISKLFNLIGKDIYKVITPIFTVEHFNGDEEEYHFEYERLNIIESGLLK